MSEYEDEIKDVHGERVMCGQLGGRPRKYDLGGFGIGQAQIIPWRVDEAGLRAKNQDAIYAAVRREEKRLGQRFARVSKPTGLLVTRVA